MEQRLPLDNGSSSTRIPEGDPSANGVQFDIVLCSVESYPNDESSIYKARVTPTTFDLSMSASGPPTGSRTIGTRIPPSPIDTYGSSECFLPAQTLRGILNTPNHPCPPLDIPNKKVYNVPHPDPNTNMGRGMFALKPLDVGDLILVERLMLLVGRDPTSVPGFGNFIHPCNNPNLEGLDEFDRSLGAFQAVLEVLHKRMSEADQKAFLALPNAFKDDPTLVGIWRTNDHAMNLLDFEDGFTYSAVYKETSRINHSCEPNCSFSFDLASFSIQVRATRPISKDDEIVQPYCDLTWPVSKRKACLSYLRIACSCPSCVPNPSIPRNDATRTRIPFHLQQLKNLCASVPMSHDELLAASNLGRIDELQKYYEFSLQVKEKACKLMEDMKAEGLEGCRCYLQAVELRCRAVMDLSSVSELLGPSVLRSQWDVEVIKLVKDTVALHKAHNGSFKKHMLEDVLGPVDSLN